MATNAPRPPEVDRGETIAPFRAMAARVPLAEIRDTQGDPRIPRDATDASFYPASSDWEVDRNDLGVILGRYARGVITFRRGDRCYWTWQNFEQSYMGGDRYANAATPVAMLHGEPVFVHPCETTESASTAAR